MLNAVTAHPIAARRAGEVRDAGLIHCVRVADGLDFSGSRRGPFAIFWLAALLHVTTVLFG